MFKNEKILSLKYRPQIFEDLIGQEITVKTIYNSIKFNKLPNAFLFTGIRGVGKTTIARIIAKALNCENGSENMCKDNFCQNCQSIINSNHLDVLELDAASRTGIDDIRELIEFSRYGPSSAKYKVFIVDEVHMLSKQAFNGLLKTLEEPPEYLKFIFATTEIKKIPVTIISRCQRFDLSRVKGEELLEYLKKILIKEKENLNEDVLKLIVKLSEGSVRDSLSLLDRMLIAKIDKENIDIKFAQETFGYIDKSSIIQLLKHILIGNENEVISSYRKLYQSGIDPKLFINDFLEILFYLKNISSLSLESNNFSLNNNEFKEISQLSEKIEPKTLLIFWQFTINAIKEMDFVSDPNICLEMFLIRLMYLKDIKKNTISLKNVSAEYNQDIQVSGDIDITSQREDSFKNKTISQIKNIHQQEEFKSKNNIYEKDKNFQIENFTHLIQICEQQKEIKLKYELETNVNLVSFEKKRIEISFNENLDKNFVKDLSEKLYKWTNDRWIISLSKKKGLETKKQSKLREKKDLFDKIKKSKIYNNIKEIFPDAELIDIKED